MNPREHKGLQDWNVLVTVYEDGFREALSILGEMGAIAPSAFHNVITMRVDDPTRFAQRLAERVAEEPGILNAISRVMPAMETTDFRDTGEFERGTRDAALGFLPQLRGRSFHVRMHRRGLKGRLSSRDEEQRLDALLLQQLDAAGAPGRITFEDPDAIVAIETLAGRAGVSLWTRENLETYPFLRLD